MHVSSFTPPLSLDPSNNHNPISNYNSINNNSYNFLPNINLNWLVQFLITALILGLGFLHLLRSTASKYFFPKFDSSLSSAMSAAASDAAGSCPVCGNHGTKRCAGCRAVYYCSADCQSRHWKSEHQSSCKSVRSKVQQPAGGKCRTSIALVPLSGSDKVQKPVGGKWRPYIALVPARGSDKINLVDKVLFPYDEFVDLFNWNELMLPPCGLENIGNSCFANVVLQCLAHTRPLVAYLLEKGHQRDCRRNGWCFLCLLEMHMDRARRSKQQPFSPFDVLSRLPSMGHGRQEDAHEFMRYAIDMMQSVCLDEHGGEKAVHPKSQETTLIQHIYGGQLQSQVKCTQCNQVSNQYENMMDLTVEIQGDATSLQECLNQFTAKELLDGENMYKCDRCKDYVVASKRLTIHQAPNILTVALKRFEGGIFGKINKKITFPESLDLSPYMSDERDGTDKYELYAVVVHVDMLNASFFGHYICYAKSFQEEWHRIDDCKVRRAELDEVLSQGAYMLMYKRISARPKCLKTFNPASSQEKVGVKMTSVAKDSCPTQMASSSNSSESSSSFCNTADVASDMDKQLHSVHNPLHPLPKIDHRAIDGGSEDSSTVNPLPGEAASNCSDVSSASDMNPQLDHVQILREQLSGVGCEPGNGGLEDLHTINHVPADAKDASTPLTAENGHDTSDLSTCSTAPIDINMVGLSATGVNAFGHTLCEASGTDLISEGIDTELDECGSEVEHNVADNTQESAVALEDQAASPKLSCFSNGSVVGSPLKGNNGKNNSEEESQAFVEEMELASVELKKSCNCCNGVVDGMTVDESPMRTSFDMPPEKRPCTLGFHSRLSDGHVELSDTS